MSKRPASYLQCYRCSKDPCICELPDVDVNELERDLQRMFYNGYHSNSCLSAQQAMWLVRQLQAQYSETAKLGTLLIKVTVVALGASETNPITMEWAEIESKVIGAINRKNAELAAALEMLRAEREDVRMLNEQLRTLKQRTRRTLVLSVPTICLGCNQIVIMTHEKGADPANGAWKCSQCGHLHLFTEWTIRENPEAEHV